MNAGHPVPPVRRRGGSPFLPGQGSVEGLKAPSGGSQGHADACRPSSHRGLDGSSYVPDIDKGQATAGCDGHAPFLPSLDHRGHSGRAVRAQQGRRLEQTHDGAEARCSRLISRPQPLEGCAASPLVQGPSMADPDDAPDASPLGGFE